MTELLNFPPPTKRPVHINPMHRQVRRKLAAILRAEFKAYRADAGRTDNPDLVMFSQTLCAGRSHGAIDLAHKLAAVESTYALHFWVRRWSD